LEKKRAEQVLPKSRQEEKGWGEGGGPNHAYTCKVNVKMIK
jgi:hypothetical protein